MSHLGISNNSLVYFIDNLKNTLNFLHFPPEKLFRYLQMKEIWQINK